MSLLLELFNPKVSPQSGDFASDGISIIYHYITNYPKTQKAEEKFYFLHPFVGQELGRAWLSGQFSVGVSHAVALYTNCNHMKLCTNCNLMKALLGWMSKVAYSPGWQVLLVTSWELSWDCPLEHVFVASLCVLDFTAWLHENS